MLFSDLATIYCSVNHELPPKSKLNSWKFITGLLLILQSLIKSFTGNYFWEQGAIAIALAAVVFNMTELCRFSIRSWLFTKLEDLRNNRKTNLCSVVLVVLFVAFVFLWIKLLSNTAVRQLDIEQITNLTNKCPRCLENLTINQSSLMGLYYLYAVPGYLIALSLMSNSKSKKKYVSFTKGQRRARFVLVSFFRSAFAVPIIFIYVARR